MSQSDRASDYQIIVGHLWQCGECREAFLADPHAMMVGLKLTEEQSLTLHGFAQSPFSLLDRLHSENGLTDSAFQFAVAHPRARLRHLGTRKAESGGQP